MKSLKIVIGTLCVLVVAAFGLALSGIYDVSAMVPHWAPTSRFLELVRDRSIVHQSKKISLPSLDTPGLAKAGGIQFDQTCRKCHGAPGLGQDEFAEGLYPFAPPLERIFDKMDRAEVFWVITNGLKFTGMPAFGVNHEPKEIAAMVAFLEKLPKLDARSYRLFVKGAESGGQGAPHRGAATGS